MAETITDIPIGQTWVDINTVSGITVGFKFSIINKGNGELLLYESSSAPDVSSKDGVPLTTREGDYAERYIPAGSLKIWCKAKSSSLGSVVNVQLI